MANDDNNIFNVLAADNDPTVELEVVNDEATDADANTFNSEDVVREKTISQLQFDVVQLRSRWLGLEAEIKAREAQTIQLQSAIDRKEEIIANRDHKIQLLQSEIRQRDENHRSLIRHCDELHQSLQTDRGEAADQLDTHHTAADLQRRLDQSEKYADVLRRQIQDLTEEVRETAARADDLQRQQSTIQQQHAQEIRLLRFELGEAQNTVIEADDLNSKLSSDLMDAQGFKEEMDRMLCEADEHATHSIEQLQKQVRKLARTADSYEQKLVSKGQAISVLLAELAKQSEQIDAIGEIDDVIHAIDTRMTEHESSQDEPDQRKIANRVTRVLVGTVDDQVLRFPLFKDRMTIGRTEDNDIQLKAAYISRRHAVIQIDGDTTRITDWGSKNGVFVNSDKVSEHFLHHGDIVAIGDARFRYEERKKRNF